MITVTVTHNHPIDGRSVMVKKFRSGVKATSYILQQVGGNVLGGFQLDGQGNTAGYVRLYRMRGYNNEYIERVEYYRQDPSDYHYAKQLI